MSDNYEGKRHRTVLLIYLLAIFERANIIILPAMYSYIALDLNATPSEMGALTVCVYMSLAFFSLIGGILGDLNKHRSIMDRVIVITIGCAIWSIMSFSFGFARWLSHAFLFSMIISCFNGFGVALVRPNGQSIIADYYKDNQRGKAFGIMGLLSNLGIILGTTYAVNIGGMAIDNGIKGWQWVMFSYGLLSFNMAIIFCVMARDPKSSKAEDQLLNTDDNNLNIMLNDDITTILDKTNYEKFKEVSKVVIGAIRNVLSLISFRCVILQGIVGVIPWKIIDTYLILYLQILGMTNMQTTYIIALYCIGKLIGGILGGHLSDLADIHYPKYGRLTIAQISIVSGIPLSLIIFKYLPIDNNLTSVILYCFVLFVMGLSTPWVAPGCLFPMFAVIVPDEDRTMIYALHYFLEEVLATPIVYVTGLAAEKIWNFEGEATVTGDDYIDRMNAIALQNTLFYFTALPWLLSFIFFFGLFCYYPKEKDMILEKKRLQQISISYNDDEI